MLPTTFWLILTYSCNDRCGYCYAASGCPLAVALDEQTTSWMTLQYAQEVMEELHACGAENCLLIGGEPTLYPQLIELVRRGRSLGLAMKLVSNGRRLARKEFVQELKDAGLVHASVSIEASNEDLHNRITHSRGFRQRLQGIRNLLDAGVSNNTILTVSTMNADEIIPVARAMRDLGVENILFNFSLPALNGKGGVNGSFTLSPQEYADRITEAYLKLRDEGIHFTFFATIPLCLIPDDVREQMVADKTIARGYHCHIFFGTGVAFEPNGNVLPCTHFVNTPLFNAMDEGGGFSYKGRFAREWKEGVHRTFVEAAWKYPAERCTTCNLWGVCVGGCPIQWMHFDPTEFITERRANGSSQPAVTAARPAPAVTGSPPRGA